MAFFSVIATAQNLVPNGGFEEGIECPSFPGNVTAQCADWYASILPAEMATPEWFHGCAESDNFSPPDVAFGFQEPYVGQGYCGFASYTVDFPIMVREIIAVNLTAPLEVGSTYLIDFKFTPIYNVAESTVLINRIGFNFSTHPYYDFDAFPINTSHYSNDTIIPLTDEWLSISQLFEADSAYEYLHIGNFYDDEMTDTVLSSENAFASYFAVDNVSVTEMLSNSLPVQTTEIIKVYPNPCSDQLKILNSSQHGIQSIEVFDLTGKRVLEKTYDDSEKSLNIELLTSGTYLIKIRTSKNAYYEKVIKL